MPSNQPPHQPPSPVRPQAPGPAATPRPHARPRPAAPTHTRPQQATDVQPGSWLPYLVVLAAAGAGLFFAWQGSRYAGLGTALVGGALLAAALARLVLPPRYAAMLTSRQKGLDVAAFAVLGAAVLALALMLP